MKNDTPVYDAVRLESAAAQPIWTGRIGTREAIARDGLFADGNSLAYCPHEWLDDQGYVDIQLVRKHPHPVPT